MFKSLKINTVLLLCIVFVFRIMFVNASAFLSIDTKKNNTLIKSHFSTVMKRSKHFDVSATSIKCGDILQEFCEEKPDEEPLKTNPLYFIQVLYSFLAVETKHNIQPRFNKYNPYTSSERYLAFQVFRI